MFMDRRTYPRIKCKIYAHIFYEQYIYSGIILDLSCWGARIKSSCKLEEQEFLRLNFVFGREYSMMAYIVEKQGKDEYRVKFTYDNIADKLALKYAISNYSKKNH
jgi:hypothetical protein